MGDTSVEAMAPEQTHTLVLSSNKTIDATETALSSGIEYWRHGNRVLTEPELAELMDALAAARDGVADPFDAVLLGTSEVSGNSIHAVYLKNGWNESSDGIPWGVLIGAGAVSVVALGAYLLFGR
jgi:hypothetical protein